MYNFMQIYGNCSVTFFLHDEGRIRGPVDNVVLKNKEGIRLLVENKYFKHIEDAIKNNSFKITSRKPSFDGDSELAYDTDIVRIAHNNPFSERFLKNIKTRCNNLNNFLKDIHKDKNKYLIYTINLCDVGIKTHKLKGKNLENNIQYLKKLNLLDKTIFVATTGTGWLNSKSKDVIPLVKKYKLNYIELYNIKQARYIKEDDFKKLNKAFLQEFKKLLEKKPTKHKDSESIYGDLLFR